MFLKHQYNWCLCLSKRDCNNYYQLYKFKDKIEKNLEIQKSLKVTEIMT